MPLGTLALIQKSETIFAKCCVIQIVCVYLCQQQHNNMTYTDNLEAIDRFVTSVIITEREQCNGYDHILKLACEELRIAKLHYIMQQDAVSRAMFCGKIDKVKRIAANLNNYGVGCATSQLHSLLHA